MRSGKRSINAESLASSNQQPPDSQYMNDRSSKPRDNSQSSSVGGDNNINGVNVYRQKLPQLSRNQNQLSHSPSDKSIEKERQQSSLLKGKAPPSAQREAQQKENVARKAQNIDRIVNIYSINNKQRKQKKFYINMISASKPEVPPPNEDIRVKLKQLREGIGYYEAQKSSGARH